ncbi:hypothetical protein [Micromonospora sp. NPDC050276]|uniref:hypothetical protein n=1 Tax=Micromonospora sp. NPDC050276 TaxID=3364278 RepID=UPI0037AB6D64
MDAPAPAAHITVRDAVAEDVPFLREVLADTFGSTMMAVPHGHGLAPMTCRDSGTVVALAISRHIARNGDQ